MHRTTIMLPAKLKAQARRRAKQLGVSLADLIRQALSESLKTNHKDRDPFFSDHAVYDGPAPSDGSSNLDYYLYGGPGDIH